MSKPKHSPTSERARTRPNQEPSAESLREMPESAGSGRYFGRGEEGLQNALAYLSTVRGRPRAGTTAVGTTARSVRLPTDAWELLDARAQELGISAHALCKRIFAEWLYTSGQVTPKAVNTRSRKRRRKVA